MEKEMSSVYIFVTVFLIIISILIGTTLVTSGVTGANQSSTTTLVNVWNTEPTLFKVTVDPSSIDLTPGNTTNISCIGYAWDYNGWTDINLTNVTFHHVYVNATSANDNNNHYNLNSSQRESNCNTTGVSSTNVTINCTFSIEYYADNGTWTCNMSITDSGGNATEREKNFNLSNNGSGTINTVLALNTPSEIDYGNLSVTETSAQQLANISNFGNVPINISVMGYGGNNQALGNNTAMLCQYGNISIENERYSIVNGTTWASMTNLSNTSTFMNLTLPVRTNDAQYGNDTNETFWRIYIPLTVGGECNGTIEFTATESIN